MTYLAESVKEGVSAQGGKWESKPYSVTCTKTAALQAECVERYKPTSGGEHEGEVDESVEVAPDGKTYKAIEHPEVKGVGEKESSPTNGEGE